jgi:ribosomal protein L13
MKALSVIGCPEIAVTGDGKKIHLEALDSRKPGNSSYKVEIGETTNDFQMIFKSDNILMLPSDYRVSISAKGLAHFQGTDVEYFVAVEHHSKFNG